jgi:2-polyprenyl-3-methyl-5-hydroxy-6-metoxy-1,4-benzoquinol methylase
MPDRMTNFKPSYIESRDDVLHLVPDYARKILDFGCSVGTLGEQIKQKFKSAEITGIEFDEQMAEVAKEKLDRIIIEDIDKIKLEDYLAPNYFDCIIFADTLEHLKNPWDVLKDSLTFLNSNGVIIASIPNVRHYSTIASLLLKGYWPYRERGIHDRTHLRFFALKNIRGMFRDAGLKIIRIKRNLRIIEKPHQLNFLSKYFAFPPIRDLLTFQYLVVARKNDKNDP